HIARWPFLVLCGKLSACNMLDHVQNTVRVYRNRVDSGLHEKLGKRRVVTRCLATKPHRSIVLVSNFDQVTDQEFYRRILLIKNTRQSFGVPTDPKRELGKVIGSNR